MNSDILKESKERIIQLINDYNPNLDTRKKTIVEKLFAGLAALGHAVISEDISNFENTMYLKQAMEDPDNFDEDTLDAILSNVLVTRTSGSKAQGKIKVEVDESRDYFVPANSEFRSIYDLKYFNESDVEISSGDLYSRNDKYYFFVDVFAEEVGSNYILTEGDILETDILSGTLSSVTVFSDFMGGIDKETNSELINRLPTSIGIEHLASPQGISVTLRKNFPDIKQITTIAYSDREMQRNLNSLGMKISGKSDIYVRTSVSPLSKTLEKTTDEEGKFIIDGDDVPILRISSISLASTPDTKLTDFEIEIDSLEKNPQFYRFSNKEILNVTCSLLSKDILVNVDYIPYISDIQTFVDDDENKYVLSDHLVKSYMPCFISCEISYRYDGENEDIESVIRAGILNYINTYSDDILYCSKVVDQLHNLGLSSLSLPLYFTGKFHLPDGTIETMKSEDYIRPTTNYNLGVSPKTYRFFCVSSDISFKKIS